MLAIQLLLGVTASAQTLNWGSMKKEHKHIITANIAFQNGMQYGAGYGYKINQKLFPVILQADYANLSGNNLSDDFKARVGGTIRWIKYEHFQFSTGLYGVFRRHDNELVQLSNFGSDMNGVIGYYRKKWFVAGEAGFDKAIVTHFKHSDAYKAQYPGVVNGWYEPSTGGNFYYGVQAGFSFRQFDTWVKAGKTIEQDFKTKPMVPMYGQLGLNLKF